MRAHHRVWGVPNVFITDGGALPTQGAANAARTIMAESSRVADALAMKRLARHRADARVRAASP